MLIEIRHIQAFLAVAAELHFGRAADRLSLAQPALSRTIQNLEEILGVQLLERTTRTVRLTEAGKTFQERGYSMTHNIYTGSLKNNAQGTVTLQLNGGIRYHIMGACDTDCSDMDLVLYDPSGKQVSSDVEDDDFPIVSASPSKTGTYSLRVMMVNAPTGLASSAA